MHFLLPLAISPRFRHDKGMTRGTRISQLATLSFGHLVTDMFGGCFAPLLPMLIVRLHTDKPTLGAVAALVGIVMNLVQPLTSGFLHRFRLPLMLLVGPLLALGFGFIGAVHSVTALTLLAVVGALGVGLYHPSALLGAHVASGTREHLGIPIFLSGGAVGVTLGSIFFTQWVAWQGFDRLWWLAPPALALLLLAYAGTRVLRMDLHQPLPEHEDAPAITLPFLPLLAMASLLAIGNSILFTYLTMHLNTFMGISEATRLGGIVLGIVSLVGAAASYLWGACSNRLSALRITAVGQLISAATLYALLAAHSPAQILLYSIPAGIFSGGAFFPIIALLGRRATGFNPGLRAGLSIGGAWFVGSLGVAIAAGCMKIGLSVTQALFVIVPLALLNAIYALVLDTTRKDVSKAV